MPIPQTAPNLVGSFLYPIVNNILGNPGPYIASDGSYFLFATTLDSDGTTYSLMAYRSTDAGISYTAIPDLVNIFSPNTTCVFYEGTGDFVYFGFISPSDGIIKFIPFKTTTGGIWHAIQPTTIVPTGGAAAVGTLWIRTVGTHVYISWDDGGGLHLIYWNGSAWSSVVDIGSAGDQMLPMTAASSSQAAVWSCDTAARGDAGSGSFFYTLFNGATLVATSTALTLPDGDNRVVNRMQYSGYYDSGSDSSVLALPMFKHSDSTGFHALLIAATTATPSFTLKTVTTFNATDTTGYPWLAGGFTLFWARTRTSDGEVLVEFSTCATLTGTWGAASLYWDQQANQPSPTPASNGVFPLTANLLSNSTTGVIVGLTETLSAPTATFGGVLFTWKPEALVASTSLRLIATVSGGTAIPADFIVNADGPMSIAGTGDTGVTAVIAGTYALSESAGPFGYTPGTYSCVKNGGAPMVTNSIGVAPSDAVVCTILNTFTGTPFPAFCVPYVNNPGGTPTFVAYDEPTELQGS